jgi:hypothetical protein
MLRWSDDVRSQKRTSVRHGVFLFVSGQSAKGSACEKNRKF